MKQKIVICVKDPQSEEGFSVLQSMKWVIDEEKGMYYIYLENGIHFEFPKKTVVWVKFEEVNE